MRVRIYFECNLQHNIEEQCVRCKTADYFKDLSGIEGTMIISLRRLDFCSFLPNPYRIEPYTWKNPHVTLRVK